jgi:drug/metabolite transporter (DMT)-like permease
VATVAGIRKLGGGQTALLLPVETMLSVCWAALFLGERISSRQSAGAILVLSSVLLATVFRRRPPVRSTEVQGVAP